MSLCPPVFGPMCNVKVDSVYRCKYSVQVYRVPGKTAQSVSARQPGHISGDTPVETGYMSDVRAPQVNSFRILICCK